MPSKPNLVDNIMPEDTKYVLVEVKDDDKDSNIIGEIFSMLGESIANTAGQALGHGPDDD